MIWGLVKGNSNRQRQIKENIGVQVLSLTMAMAGDWSLRTAVTRDWSEGKDLIVL